MVRSDRNYPDIYFGRPGALFKLPAPRGDVDRSFDRPIYDFVNATGGHIISSMIGGSRTFGLGWNALHVDTFSVLEQFWLGQMGQGPWAYIDPAQTNMLLPNQASATNIYSDVRDFTTNFVGVLQTNAVASQIHRTGATRSLRWYWQSAPGPDSYPVMTLNAPYRSWYGYPVVPGLPYMFSAYAKPDGSVDTSITVAAKLQWVNATGTQLSEMGGPDTPVSSWQRLSIGGVAPAGAAFARPLFVVTGATVLAGSSLFLDELMLEQDTVLNNWAPGTGTRPVEIVGLNEPVPFNRRFRSGVTMTLRELVV